jgi:hypothetical protein
MQHRKKKTPVANKNLLQHRGEAAATKKLLIRVKNYSYNIRESPVAATKNDIVATIHNICCNIEKESLQQGRDLTRHNPSHHQTLRSRGEGGGGRRLDP